MRPRVKVTIDSLYMRNRLLPKSMTFTLV